MDRFDLPKGEDIVDVGTNPGFVMAAGDAYSSPGQQFAVGVRGAGTAIPNDTEGQTEVNYLPMGTPYPNGRQTSIG